MRQTGETDTQSPAPGEPTSASPSDHTADSESRTGSQPGLKALLGTSSIMFLLRVTGAAAAFLTQMLLARWMGAHELGIYVYAFSWMIILATIISLGYEMACFRVIGQALSENNHGVIRGYLRRGRQLFWSLGVASSLMLAFLISTVDGLVDPAYRTTLLIALIVLPVYLTAVLHEAISHAFSWLYMMILPNTVFRPLLLLIAVAIVWWWQGDLTAVEVMSYQLAAMILVTTLHFFVFRKLLKKHLDDSPPHFATRQWIRIGLPQLVPMLYISFLPEISVIMVGFFLPADEVAIFSVAFRVAMLISFMIFAVDSIFRPKAALLYAEQDHDELQKLTSNCTLLMFWPGLICVIVFVLFGQWILGFFGEEFIAGYRVFALLSACQLIIVFFGPLSSLLNVTGHQDHSMVVFSVALLAILVLDVLLVPTLGMTGAAIGVIAVTAMWNLWMNQLVRKHLNIHTSLISASINLLQRLRAN